MANEVERDTVDYRDTTPFDGSKLQSLSEISKAIRHKTYGEDVREPIAQQGEALVKLMTETGGNQSAEVAAARGNFELLGIREDAQDNAVAVTNAKLANKADKDYINKYLSQVSYSPETVASLAELNAKYPNGKPGLFVTADNGHKYIWVESEKKWHDAGIYQTQGMPLNSLTRTGSIIWATGYHANLITTSKDYILELPLSLISTGIKPFFNIKPTGSNEGEITTYSLNGFSKIGGYVVFNQATEDIYGIRTNEAFNNEDVVIGQVWANGDYHLSGGGACYLNGQAQMNREKHSIPAEVVSAAAQPALVNSDGILSIDLDAKTIEFEGATNVDLAVGKTRLYYGSLKFDGSELVKDDPQTIVIDLADNTIKSVKRNTPQPDSCATILRLWNWNLGQYYATNSNLLIKVNGQIINNATKYGFNNESLAIGGDSTVAGFIGQKDPEHHIHTRLPVDHWINLRLGLKTDNIGVDGASIFGTGEKSLATINAKVDWTKYTKYGLQIGVNDYQANAAPLADVIKALKAQLDLIYNANPNIKIYAALPLHSFRKPGWVEGEALNTQNSYGDTLNDYMDALKSTYREYDINVLDWRDSPIITKRGYKSQTTDFLHPNDHTYVVMGQRWASFIENNR